MPVKDSAGLVLRWFGTNTDISELRKAEEAQGRLGAIVESADDAIISKDLNGIIQTWNIGAEKMFGYKAEEIIGRPVSLLIPPGHIDEVPEILARIKQGEHIEQFETVRMRKNGTIIPVSLTFSAVKDASGRIIGASKIAHDITERKNAEEEIRRHAEELSVKNEELELFNRAAVGRELRMVELKKEVNKLHIRVGGSPRYNVDFEGEQP
jgi:PAS domain S-box-containing protein